MSEDRFGSSYCHAAKSSISSRTVVGVVIFVFDYQGSAAVHYKALQENPDPIEEAKQEIRETGRTPEDMVPVLSLPPGQAHRTAAVTYQNRNIEEGKCSICPKPLAPNSVRYCEKHLAACRNTARVRAKKLNKPPHGRAPGTLAALAEGRKKQRVK